MKMSEDFDEVKYWFDDGGIPKLESQYEEHFSNDLDLQKLMQKFIDIQCAIVERVSYLEKSNENE